MTLHQITQTPEASRDQSWENRFFQALSKEKINVLSAEPQSGPDGWPYLLTETSDEATEPTAQIIHWLADKGIGLVVNPMKEYPDYVFTYGMIWSFKETGYFFKPLEKAQVQTAAAGAVEFDNMQVQAGNPTAEYLPLYVRKVLQDFFRDQSILRPKILMVSTDGGPNYDLAFSLESLGNPPESEHAGIGEAISWFLPPHYSLLLVSEKGLPAFYDL